MRYLPELSRKKKITIVGQGYVGLPLAVAAASIGWKVTGIDKSLARVLELNKGESPVEDVSNNELRNVIAKGNYFATSEPSEVGSSEIVVFCVPTPLNESRQPDLSLLQQAVKEIAPFLKDGALVISESTSYPGTLRDVIIPIIKAYSPQNIDNLLFASAPERVNPGDKKWNMKNIPRLVGGIDKKSLELAVSFYETFCDEVVSTSTPEIAEAAKLLENTFRMVNISLVLELTQILDKAGLNINEVIDAAATKPYGFMPFRPGLGIGGHCIPIDPLYLTWWANEQGVPARIVEMADSMSQSMPAYVARKAMLHISKEAQASTILIIGVAYKSGISDVRETPVKNLKTILENFGASVIWHDPLIREWEGTSSSSLDANFDLAIVATNQPGMDLKCIADRGIPIIDCTNGFGYLSGVISI